MNWSDVLLGFLLGFFFGCFIGGRMASRFIQKSLGVDFKRFRTKTVYYSDKDVT